MARTQGSHSDITGPRVRAAALELFAQKGFAAVSMRQIAAAVGVQAGALYNYTPDKQSLLFDLMRGHMDELLAARAATVRPTEPMAALEDFTRFHIRFHEQRGQEIFLAYNELRNLTPENFAAIEDLRNAYEKELEGILRAGAEAGAFAVKEPSITTKALIAMLTGITTWFRPDGRLSIADIEELYWDMVQRAVRA